MRSTDISIKDVSFDTEEYLYRTPIKFGGVILDRVTLLDAEVEVESRSGKRARGRGSMPLGNVWAFPSRVLAYQQTLAAMQRVAERVARIYSQTTLNGHPIEITWRLESEFHRAAKHVASELQFTEPIPPLATMVAASPFDAALHDAFGKLHELNVYRTYSREFLDDDLGRFFGSHFRGVAIDRHLSLEPVDQLPLYHLVGAIDPILPTDVVNPIGDGLPESLVDWIKADGLTHLKIKLNGDDLDWDVQRVLRVQSATESLQRSETKSRWRYSLDFNEKCRSVKYLLAFIERLRVGAASALERIAYIEQPTGRDLAANRNNVMHAASAVIPVVIDESLLDLESLLLAREMGYSGVALKACKGQTQSILLSAAAKHLQMSLCVQDLTCPGASLIQSAGLAAHIQGVAAIEANSRQYCPNANVDWARRFPGVFVIKDGTMETKGLNGLGLGAYSAE